MSFLYLLALVVALAGMVVLDWRFRLFFWRSPIRAAIVLVVGLAFFLVWGLQGIRLGIFFRGETSFMTGWEFARELPIEEPFFLLLLCYLAMNLYGVVGARVSIRAARYSTTGVTGADDPRATTDAGNSGGRVATRKRRVPRPRDSK